jgi:acyl-CoA synthetase (AMP-forming)/AMP-acid ligase II
MPGMEYRLVDIGRAAEVADGEVGVLQLRGDTLFVDMVKRERRDVLTPDGWYDTGDLCIRREGQVFFQGRADDMIKAAGANVSPREVEEVLLATPGISRAIVLSVPDDARGAVVGAVVVRQEGAALTAEDLRASASSKLSSFKVPKVIVFMQDRELPVQHTGKLDRRALQRRLQDEHKRRR